MAEIKPAWRVRIRDRHSGGGIEVIADFVMVTWGLVDEATIFKIVKAAYPGALEHHVKGFDIDG